MTTEEQALVAEVDRDFRTALFHLNEARKRLSRLGKDFGLTYGDDEHDALGLVNAAIGQAKYDRDYLMEFISAVNS